MNLQFSPYLHFLTTFWASSDKYQGKEFIFRVIILRIVYILNLAE